VPGGVVGTLGGLVLAWGCWLAFDIGPLWGMGAVLASVAAAASTLVVISKTRVARRLVLEDKSPANWHAAAPELAGLLGREGIAATTLRPAGIATIDGRRVDVVSAGGELIARDTPIAVTRVEGTRVVVAPSSTAPPEP
jgi:membrane-bound serine protease (ClpP class)